MNGGESFLAGPPAAGETVILVATGQPVTVEVNETVISIRVRGTDVPPSRSEVGR